MVWTCSTAAPPDALWSVFTSDPKNGWSFTFVQYIFRSLCLYSMAFHTDFVIARFLWHVSYLGCKPFWDGQKLYAQNLKSWNHVRVGVLQRSWQQCSHNTVSVWHWFVWWSITLSHAVSVVVQQDQTKEQSREANTLKKQWLQKILSPVDTVAAEPEPIVQVGALTRRAFGCINQAITSIKVNVISDWV